MSNVQTIRHCAYCLESLAPSDEMKSCDKCHRRPYCSEECRALDWDGCHPREYFPGLGFVVEEGDGSGQHHKQWCGLGVLEEDVDWEVVPVEGKGLGIVAKTLIPPMSRIVVDGLIERDRTRHFNHSCDANASRLIEDDEEGKRRWPGAHMVFSKREIQPGEEICVNYTELNESPWMVVNSENKIHLDTPGKCRRLLKLENGITCPRKCFCRKKGLGKAVADWKRTTNCLGCSGCKAKCLDAKTKEEAVFELDHLMKKVELALQGNEELKGNQMTKAILLEKGFEIASRSNLTLDKGLEFIKEAVAIRKTVGHPKSLNLEKMEAYLKNPSSYEDYLCLDKKWGKLDRATLCENLTSSSNIKRRKTDERD